MPEQTPVETLREQAVSVTAEQLRLSPSEAYPAVWGVVMEYQHGGQPVVVVAMADGATSLYFGTQSGYIGVGWLPEIREASDHLLDLAQGWYPHAEPIDWWETPAPGVSAFLLHGWDGRRRVLIDNSNPGQPGTASYALFSWGHGIITLLRQRDEAGKLKPKSYAEFAAPPEAQ